MHQGQEVDSTSRAFAWALRVGALVIGAVVMISGTSSAGTAITPRTAMSQTGAQPSPNHSTPSTGPVVAPATSGSGFAYGFDFTTNGPYQADPTAIKSAMRIMGTFAGSFMDVNMMGWGVGNPEQSPGVFDFHQLAARIALVQSTGGVPIITLSAAPDWMKGGVPGITDWTRIDLAPLAQHYADYAALCAAIAKAFPQVKYFAVWKEMKGFWSTATNQFDSAGYTTMYNTAYTAIKAVRPDALVGGPYMAMQSVSSTWVNPALPHGTWGSSTKAGATSLSYWLANKVGADFVALDGDSYTKNAGLITDPISSTAKYAAIDTWLRAQTTLPIAWMESHVLPDPTQWTENQQTAVRVATLIQMGSSGAAAGLQWQPQQQVGWDEGLWTSTDVPTGGKVTVLGNILPQVVHVLRSPVTILPGQPAGTLVATGALGTITVNLNGGASSVVVTGPTH